MGSRIALVFSIIFLFLIVNSCFAQLTFSPNWGKRNALNQLDFVNSAANALNNGNGINSDSSNHYGSTAHGATNPNGNNNNCKPSIDSLMVIYRLIQMEAEKLDECLQK